MSETPGPTPDHPESRERLLTLDDVAEITGTSLRMARRLVSERRLPVVKIGRHVRVSEPDLRAFIASNTRPALGHRPVMRGTR
jgi:excisionase family DNA binding protein